MKFGSVCSGIEAASVAWGSLGWEAAWFSEIEPFPSAVLAHHYPHVNNVGDMTALPSLIEFGFVEAPDVLCGGTPCQAFSIAGLRRSLDDERGNLTLIFCEIANAIDISRANNNIEPCIVFWENVPGVLSTKDNAFGCFLAGLAGENLPLLPPGGKWTNAGCVLGPKRAVAWRVLDAQYFGVAQRRRRVFVVASARNGFNPVKVLFEFEGVRRDTPPSREARQNAAADAGAGAAGGGLGTDFNRDGCGSSGVRYAHYSHEYANDRITDPAGVNPALTAQKTASGNLNVLAPVAFHQTQDPISSTDGTTHAMGCGSSGGMATVAVAYTTKLHNTASNQAGKFYEEYATSLDRSSPPPAVLTAMQVRRLTPRECERLQGFPDDYTLIPWRNKPADQCPDGPRYKALGNSWAVPVVRWIGERISDLVVFGTFK